MKQVDHMSPVLRSRGAKTIVGPIPTMTMGIGYRAHQKVLVLRGGHSTLPKTMINMAILPSTSSTISTQWKAAAQHAQNFKKIDEIFQYRIPSTSLSILYTGHT